jgi:hypothetical protein
MQPTKCLQLDTEKRLRARNIKAVIYPTDGIEDEDGVPSVILVTPEATAHTTNMCATAEYDVFRT